MWPRPASTILCNLRTILNSWSSCLTSQMLKLLMYTSFNSFSCSTHCLPPSPTPLFFSWKQGLCRQHQLKLPTLSSAFWGLGMQVCATICGYHPVLADYSFQELTNTSSPQRKKKVPKLLETNIQRNKSPQIFRRRKHWSQTSDADLRSSSWSKLLGVGIHVQ